MSVKKRIQYVADHLFTADDKFTWYDHMWENLGGYNKPDRVKQREISKRKAADYFNDNWDRVEKVKSWLYDEKSRIIYENLIRFAMTGDRKYHHGYDPNQYFPKDVVNLNSDEVFVDCGGYTADTTLDFVNRTKSKGYKRIITFEPDPKLSDVIKKNIEPYDNIVYIPKGVYSITGNLYFDSDGTSGGTFLKNENANHNGNKVKVEVTKIDDVPECTDATYIKMDLEGSEWDALHGAEKTILCQKPKLGICIYHTNEDRIRLIEYIHELVPEYKLYVRQHSKGGHETVVYAIN